MAACDEPKTRCVRWSAEVQRKALQGSCIEKTCCLPLLTNFDLLQYTLHRKDWNAQRQAIFGDTFVGLGKLNFNSCACSRCLRPRQ